MKDYMITASRQRKLLYLVFINCLFSYDSIGQCIHTIYANDSLGCVNEIINFKIHPKLPSTAKVEWVFPNKKSTDKTPSIPFTKTGEFDVKATIQFSNGSSCNITRNDYISISDKPNVGTIKVSPSTLCNINEDVRLSSSSTNASSFTWTVGSSVYYNAGSSITHKVQKAGVPLVQLIIANNHGCVEKVFFDSLFLVARKPAVSLLPYDTTICQHSEVEWQPKTDLYGQSNLSFLWNYENGLPKTSTNILGEEVLYKTTGNHGITLNVQEKNTQCNWDYDFGTKVSVLKGEDISINVDNPPPNNCGISTYDLSLSPITLNPALGYWVIPTGRDSVIIDSNGNEITLAYKYPGNYPVTYVYRGPNCTQIISKELKVRFNNFQAQFDKNFNCICSPPEQVRFENKSNTTGNGYTYEWYMEKVGENKIIATSKNPDAFTPTISVYGNYLVNLTVTDQNGCEDSYFARFRADTFQNLLKPTPQVVCPETIVPFEIWDTTCFDTVIATKWILETSKGDSVINGLMTEFEYEHEGYYDVTVISTTAKGCKDSLYLEDYIRVDNLQNVIPEIEKPITCLSDEQKLAFSLFPADFAVDIESYIFNDFGDTFTYKSYQADLKEIKFSPNKPGIYHLFLGVSTENCNIDTTLQDAFYVEGVDFELKTDSSEGCLPFQTNLYADPLVNYVFSTNDQSLTYKWDTKTGSRVDILTPFSDTATVTITKAGRVDMTLEITNASGCVSKNERIAMFDFDVEPRFSLPKAYCSSIPLRINNISTGNIVSYKWSSNTGAIFLPSDSAVNPYVTFPSSGTHNITLTIEGDDGCIISKTAEIDVVDFSFDFNVLDNSPKCSPAEFTFQATGTNVDSFIWDFGTGKPIKTAQNLFLKIYDLQRIRPLRNAFDVQLIAKNNFGCADTLTKEDLIQVRGPVVRFGTNKPKGCNPYKVQFYDSSLNVEKLYVHFGDTTDLDSNNVLSHTYHVEDSVGEYQSFMPTIVARDSSGCRVSTNLLDSIEVYRYPEIQYSIDTQQSCSPFKPVFKDSSLYGYQYYWDFNNDKIIDDTLKEPSPTLYPDVYDVNVIVENAIGCQSTLLKPAYISVYPNPSVHFRADTIACLRKPMQFENFTSSQTPIKQYFWDFGDTLTKKDTSSQANPSYIFPRLGKYDIKLIAQDTNNCADTLTKENYIEVFEEIPIKDLLTYYLSVTEQNEVILAHAKAQGYAFKEYYLSHNNAVITKSRSIDDTLKILQNLAVDSASQCIQYQLLDKCGTVRAGPTHCTIHLTIDPTIERAASLDWTAYVGWDSVLAYGVMRKREPDGQYKLIATLDHQTTHFVDSQVCDFAYRYKIVAYHPAGKYQSESNRRNFSPTYLYQQAPLHVSVATIDSLDRVLLTWNKSVQDNIQHYRIDRYTQSTLWRDGYVKVLDTFFIDTAAFVNHRWHAYRVTTADQCGYISQPGKIGKTIWLRHQYDNTDVKLFWNHYEEWEEGILQYDVYRSKSKDSSFEKVSSIEPADSVFLDKDAYHLFLKPFYYRVEAIEAGLAKDRDTSRSNIIRVNPLPTAFAPNAFTPNGDGLNDSFRIEGIGFANNPAEENYHLQIFNRWGTEVFTSTAHSKAWGGNSKGKPCKPGVYVWVVEIKGQNQETLFLQGTITLIR